MMAVIEWEGVTTILIAAWGLGALHLGSAYIGGVSGHHNVHPRGMCAGHLPLPPSPAPSVATLAAGHRVRGFKASPSWEVPTLEAPTVLYRPAACSYARAIAIHAGVVVASVATMAPLIVASGGNSCNHTPGSVHGCRYMGVAIGVWWGYNVAWTPKCFRRCVLRAGSSSDGTAYGTWWAM